MTVVVTLRPHVTELGDSTTVIPISLAFTINTPLVLTSEEIIDSTDIVSDWSNPPPFLLQQISENFFVSPPHRALIFKANTPSIRVSRNIRCYIDPAIFTLEAHGAALSIEFDEMRAREETELTELLGLFI